MYSVPCNLFYEVQIHTILHHHAFPTRKKNERKKVLPTLLKVDNLNAKCNSENRSMLLLASFQDGFNMPFRGFTTSYKKV